MRGVFVTGTDTGAGKTVLAASICAVLRARGVRVAAFKPVVTGVGGSAAGAASHAGGHGSAPDDDVLLAACCGADPAAVTPHRFAEPASPHHAAALEGAALDPAKLVAAARAAGAGAEALVVEGVGGLLVPLTLGYAVRDLAADLGLPVVIAARPGLGTINHTRLTVESARAAGLDVRAVVLGPWPQAPTALERSNRETIAALCGVEVATLPLAPELTPAALAHAGAALPLDGWLDTAAAPAEPG